MRVATILQAAGQEFRYGLRRLRKSPGFTASAVLVMAIGIGSSTAVFSVVDRVLFRSLPYAQDSRLVSVGVTRQKAHRYLASKMEAPNECSNREWRAPG